nr:unnamed protein product [Digitaria exilis]
MRKGLWSPDEDERLYGHITNYGVGTWSSPNPVFFRGPVLFPTQLARSPDLLLFLFSLADMWAPPVGALFFLAPWSKRTRRRVRSPAVFASAFPSRKPSRLSTQRRAFPRHLELHSRAQTLALAADSIRVLGAAFVRVEVRKPPSPLSLFLSLSRAAIARRELPPFLPSQSRRALEPPSPSFADSGEVPARRRRVQPRSGRRLAPLIQSHRFRLEPNRAVPVSQNGPFEGDQDQVYEEEPPQYFEQGKTDNEIKNYWNSRIKKKLRRMGTGHYQSKSTEMPEGQLLLAFFLPPPPAGTPSRLPPYHSGRGRVAPSLCAAFFPLSLSSSCCLDLRTIELNQALQQHRGGPTRSASIHHRGAGPSAFMVATIGVGQWEEEDKQDGGARGREDDAKGPRGADGDSHAVGIYA